MVASSSDQPDDIATELLAQYDEALATETSEGHQASSVSEQLDELPTEWAAAKRCLEMLHRVRRHRSPPGSANETPGWNENSSGLAIETPVSSPSQLGRFRIERELGRGGLGIVYLAFDPKLGRQIALKVPRFEAFHGTDLRRRFLREAAAAARLSHPHLVTVYEAGEEGPICYIAAEYCPGPTLADWLRERQQPVHLAEAARCVRQLAEGVQHAHGRGVLHRDIKPSNVLLTAPVEVRKDIPGAHRDVIWPKLTDFGMAKLLEQSGDETRSGALIGTPAYMAPEQAEGRVRDLDARTDVYGLGAVLYELLTGRRPYEGLSDVDVLRRVLFEEPPAPRRLRKEIPRDLEAICLKCLAKPSAARYATAQQLADDLGRFLRHEPTEARALGAIGRVAKWARRRPAIAALWGLASTAAVALLCVVLVYDTNLRVREREAREYAYGADMMLAAQAWENAAAGEARALLERHLPKPGQDDLRGFEWHTLWNRFEQDSIVVARQPTAVWSMAVSRDGQLVATGDPQGMIRLWDRKRRALIRELPGHEAGHIDRLVFLFDGAHLVSAGNDRTLRWWNVSTGENLLTWSEHTDWVGALANSPDGLWLLSGGGDGRVLLWSVAKRALECELYRHPGAVRWAVFSPHQPWVVSACEAGQVRVWNYEENLPLAFLPESRLECPPNPAWRDAVFRPDGHALYASNHSKILDWNLREETPQKRRLDVLNSFTDRPLALAFLDKLGLLVEGGEDEPAIVTRRFNVLRRSVDHLRGHTDAIRCLTVLSDGSTLLSGAEDGTVRQWDFAKSDPEGRQIDLSDPPRSITWSPESDRLWIVQRNRQVITIDRPDNPMVVDRNQPVDDACCILPLPEKQAVLIARQGAVSWYDGHSRGPIDPVFQVPADVMLAAINSSEKWLAYGLAQSVTVIGAGDGRKHWGRHLAAKVEHVVFLNDGSLAAGCGDGRVYRLAASDGRVLAQSAPHRNSVIWLDLSDDGRRVVTAAGDRTVRILDAATLAELAVFSRSTDPERAWFIDRDQRLLVISAEEAVVINPRTGQNLLTLPIPRGNDFQVSPDGRWLAVASVGMKVWLLRLREE